MKKIILIIAFISVSMLGKAQCNLPYKPLAEFNKDTTAFMIYNFMDRKDCYKGKTLKEVTKDLGIPIKYYVDNRRMRGSHFGGIYIYIYDRTTAMKMEEREREDNTIFILWETPVNINEPAFKKFRSTYPDWYKGAYDYVKDMKIKELYVVIPRYSKYYEKYKEKETKSHDPNKRREGDW
jgi:hypothetical protein